MLVYIPNVLGINEINYDLQIMWGGPVHHRYYACKKKSVENKLINWVLSETKMWGTGPWLTVSLSNFTLICFYLGIRNWIREIQR